MWGFPKALLVLAFARKAKAPRFTPRGSYSESSTQELNHRADNFYFDLVNSEMSLYEKTGAEPCGSAPDYFACPRLVRTSELYTSVAFCFVEEPRRGIEPLSPDPQTHRSTTALPGPQQLCVNRVSVLERKWPDAFASGH